jgi:elongation factor Tu
MRNCQACKQSIPDGARACPSCGKPVGGFWHRWFGGKSTMPKPPGFSTEAEQAAGPFSMMIEDVFSIRGRGMVVTGRIQCGEIKVGDQVRFVTPSQQVKVSMVTGIELFRKTCASAKAGDNVGLLLKGVETEEVAKGIELTKPD